MTPVCSLACAGGHLAVVEVLLQQGADPFHKLKVCTTVLCSTGFEWMNISHEKKDSRFFTFIFLVQDNSTMLIEAAKGGHTTVVQMLIDYPNSLVVGALDPNAVALDSGGHPPAALMPPETSERVPPPGGELVANNTVAAAAAAACVAPLLPAGMPINQVDTAARVNAKNDAAAAALNNNSSVLRKGGGNVSGPPVGAASAVPPPAATVMTTTAGGQAKVVGEVVGGGGGGNNGGGGGYAAASLLDGSSAGYHLLEDLERKGLDAKTYIQTMLRLAAICLNILSLFFWCYI